MKAIQYNEYKYSIIVLYTYSKKKKRKKKKKKKKKEKKFNGFLSRCLLSAFLIPASFNS